MENPVRTSGLFVLLLFGVISAAHAAQPDSPSWQGYVTGACLMAFVVLLEARK